LTGHQSPYRGVMRKRSDATVRLSSQAYALLTKLSKQLSIPIGRAGGWVICWVNKCRDDWPVLEEDRFRLPAGDKSVMVRIPADPLWSGDLSFFRACGRPPARALNFAAHRLDQEPRCMESLVEYLNKVDRVEAKATGSERIHTNLGKKVTRQIAYLSEMWGMPAGEVVRVLIHAGMKVHTKMEPGLIKASLEHALALPPGDRSRDLMIGVQVPDRIMTAADAT
jgi:hypothetical protein